MVRPSGEWNPPERCATLDVAFHTLEARVPDAWARGGWAESSSRWPTLGSPSLLYAAFTAVPVGARMPLRCAQRLASVRFATSSLR